MNVVYRAFQPADLEPLRAIMVDAFGGVAIDHGIEQVFGVINDRDWKWRKGRHLDEDVARDRDGIIVAEQNGKPIGFISTWVDAGAGIGNIPNLCLLPECRGKGVGRKLIQLAFERFRKLGLTHAKIETLAQNEIGNHLYRDCGFEEVARQVHFVAKLDSSA